MSPEIRTATKRTADSRDIEEFGQHADRLETEARSLRTSAEDKSAAEKRSLLSQADDTDERARKLRKQLATIAEDRSDG